MRRHARILRRFTAAHVGMALTYRGAFVLFMLGTIAVPVISLLTWRAALASGAKLPVDRAYVTTYFVIVSFVMMATSSWMARFLSDAIRLGRLSAWMIRPAPSWYDFAANNLAEKLLKSVVLLPMIGGLALIFADSLHVPARASRWALFTLSIVLGAILVFVIDLLIGSLGFWFDDISALDRGRVLVANLLSGAMVPLALMPSWLQGFVEVQPFRYTVSFPVEIVAGDLGTRALVTGLGLQLGYVVLACAAARLVWRAGLRAYSAVGA